MVSEDMSEGWFVVGSSNTKTAVAVKDSSVAKIAKIFGNDNKYCVQVYRKKQEFGPSKLSILNNLCKGEMNNFIQEGSVYEEN